MEGVQKVHYQAYTYATVLYFDNHQDLYHWFLAIIMAVYFHRKKSSSLDKFSKSVDSSDDEEEDTKKSPNKNTSAVKVQFHG